MAKKGGRNKCRACGEFGHHAARDGLCSKAYRAVRLVIDGGFTQAQACRLVGAHQQTVSEAVAKARR